MHLKKSPKAKKRLNIGESHPRIAGHKSNVFYFFFSGFGGCNEKTWTQSNGN
jgi:hypothetical protein